MIDIPDMLAGVSSCPNEALVSVETKTMFYVKILNR